MRAIESGSVTSPEGFRAVGIHCGIKPDSVSKDLAVVHSATSASAAAVYTTNRVQAAPIAIDREHLDDRLSMPRGPEAAGGTDERLAGGLEDPGVPLEGEAFSGRVWAG